MRKNIIAIFLAVLIILCNTSIFAYTSPYSEPSILIRKGTYGSGVKWVQDMLNHNGYSLAVDGIFGNATYNAVLNFQRNHNLSVDGIVGQATRNALKKWQSLLPAFNRGSKDLLQIIKNCKAYYANNNFAYDLSAGTRTIPADKSKLYSGKYCVDCSTFVSWVLYEYALANGKTNMQNYFSTQKNSTVFANIGANGGNSYLSVVGKDLSLAKPGDILVTNGHVEFFSSYTKYSNTYVNIKVYNCGSNTSIHSAGLTTSGTTNPADIKYILRVK